MLIEIARFEDKEEMKAFETVGGHGDTLESGRQLLNAFTGWVISTET
jgi:hypothetical protein